jgi:hypothetical protein
MTSQLERLDNQPVRVDVSWAGVTRIFRGRGKYSTDEALGPVLGVAVDDPSGNFEFLITDEIWSGEILEDSAVKDGYRIRLDSLPCT